MDRTNQKNKKFFTAGVINAVVSIALLVTAGALYWNSYTWIQHSTRVSGIIIELTDIGSQHKARPRITYTDMNMTEHTFDSPSRSNTWHVGQHVTVYYKTDDPSQARFGSFTSLWLGPLLCGIFGVVQLIVSLVLLLLSGVIRLPRRTISL